MSRQLSRRSFIKTTIFVSGGAALAACTPTATVIPPTEAPKAEPATEMPATAAPVATVVPQVGAKKLTFASYTYSEFESAMNKVLDKWTEMNPGVTVERQYAPWEEFWTRLQTQLAGGTPPDVTISDFGRIMGFGLSDALLNLSPYLEANNFPLSRMNPASVSVYRWKKGDFAVGAKDGNLYGIPVDMQNCVFYYNKKLFDAAGVEYPTDDWTWDNVVEAGKKLTNKEKNQYGTGIPGMIDRGLWHWMAGADLHTPDYQKSLLDSPESISVYKWLWDLVYTYKIAPVPDPSANTNPFISGQIAMNFDGVWAIPDYVTAFNNDYDVALLPKHPKTGKRTTSIESDGFWAFKATKEPDLVCKLLVYLTDPDGQKTLGKLGYFIPSSYPDVAKEWFSITPPEHRMKALDNINQDSRFTDLTYFDCQAITAAYQVPIAAALADGTDIETAAKDAAKIMNDELGKAWQRFTSA
jgi:multiple sugar transport system substrate-binding protein